MTGAPSSVCWRTTSLVPISWRLDEATELASEVDWHPGADSALAVEEMLRAFQGENILVPEVGMSVEALPAIEPEANKSSGVIVTG